MPVPPGFTITTEVCAEYTQYARGKEAVMQDAHVPKSSGAIAARRETDRHERSAIPEMPLLVSVRSGARASMPGMMDTVLNLGMNDATVESLAKKSGNPRFAWD